MGGLTQWMSAGAWPHLSVGSKGCRPSTPQSPFPRPAPWPGLLVGMVAEPPAARSKTARHPPSLQSSSAVPAIDCYGQSSTRCIAHSAAPVVGCAARSQRGPCCWLSWWWSCGRLCRSHRVDSLHGRQRGRGRGQSSSYAPLRVLAVLPWPCAAWLAPVLGCCSVWARSSQTGVEVGLVVGVCFCSLAAWRAQGLLPPLSWCLPSMRG